MTVSAVIKAEISASKKYYGYGALANCLDLMVPMIYKSSNDKDTSWIVTTTKYIVSKTNGTPVLAGLENYNLDPSLKPLSTLAVNYDIKIDKANRVIGTLSSYMV